MISFSRMVFAILLAGLGVALAVYLVHTDTLSDLTDRPADSRPKIIHTESPSGPDPRALPAMGSALPIEDAERETRQVESSAETAQLEGPLAGANTDSVSPRHKGASTQVSSGEQALSGRFSPPDTPGASRALWRQSDASRVVLAGGTQAEPGSQPGLLQSVSEMMGRLQQSQDETQRQLEQLRSVNGGVGSREGARGTGGRGYANPLGGSGSGEGDSPAAVRTPPRITRAPGEGDDRLGITFQNADIREVLEALGKYSGRSIIALDSVQGTVSGTLESVDVMTALDAILKSKGLVRQTDGPFIYVGTQQDFQSLQRAKERVGTRLYRPNYVRAADLQTMVTPLLTQGVGVTSVTMASEVGIEEDATRAGGDGFAGQEALLVRDYEDVLNDIDQVVVRLDQRPTQVAIEAMILSVKIDDSNEMGLNFELFRDKGTLRLVSGMPPSSLDGISLTDSGLKVGFLDSSLSMFLTALEQVGDTNVIATPRLLCLNKHPAQIKIGSELGYVSQTLTPEGTIVPEVQFLDVGTQLRLRPFISSDGLVRMEVHPEISKGSVRVEDGLTLPDKETTEVTTNIMVRDGNTVVIGGLLRDEVSKAASQIPLLGSLPIIGPAFRQNEEGTERQEILVLITPRIIYDHDATPAGDVAAAEFHQRHAVYKDKQIPFGGRYLGRKYLRLAQEAWQVGNLKRALRLVNLAIHFDPNSRAAIRMRNDLWEGNPPTAYADDPRTPLDGEHLPPWLIDRLKESEPNHPLDPGRPGERYIISPPQDTSGSGQSAKRR